jgi:hypothetical protein
MTPDEFREHFRRVTEKAGGAAAWGRQNGGISRQYIFQVLNNERPPSPAILNALGMTGATTYAPVKKRVPVSPSLTDLSDPENVKQCAFEMTRRPAEQWRDKWGEALIRYAENQDAQDQISRLQSELDEMEDDLHSAESDAAEARGELDDLAAVVSDAIEELEPLTPFHSEIPNIIAKLKDAI